MSWKGNMTRRDFLISGSGGASALTFMLKTGPLLKASGKPWAANDQINVGIIGMGIRGYGLMESIRSLEGTKMVAVSDLYDGRLKRAREVISEVSLTTRDYKEILARKEVDVVIIATPDHWHKDIAIEAMSAGKHVYCEKPLTHSIEEGKLIIDAARKTGRIVQVGSQRKSSILFAKAKEIYESGALGNLLMVETSINRNTPMGAWQYPIPLDASEETIDWKRFLGSAPSKPFDPSRFFRWRCWWDYSAGVAGDLFVHLLTGLHYITSSNGPKRVMSTGGIYRWKDGRDVPDLHVALYDYPQGFHVNIRVNLGSSGPEVTRFYGTEGTLDVGNDLKLTSQNVYEELDGIIESWAETMQKAYMENYRKDHPLPLPRSGNLKRVDERYVTPPHYDDTREHLFNFIQAARGARAANEDAEFGSNAATAAHLANLSYLKGRPVIWDAKTQVLS